MAKKTEKTGARFTEIRNSKAARNYFLEDKFEAGIVLKGTEVKSIRAGKAQVNEAFVRIEKGEPILYGAHIDEYKYGNLGNHTPKQPRKLLLNKKEIRKIQAAIEAGGYTVVPVRMYAKGGLIKVEIALGKGKKLFDKREDLKKKAMMRDVDRTMKHYR